MPRLWRFRRERVVAVAGPEDADRDATVATRGRRATPDDNTVVTRRRKPDGDDTVVTRRGAADAEKTVATRRGKVDVDDTVVEARRERADDAAIDNTVASLTQRPDRTRKVVRRAPSTAPSPPLGAPGVLADGRVASKPGRHVERYPVRVAEPPPLALVRTTEVSPVVEARRNLDPAAIAERTAQRRMSEAVWVFIAIALATATALAGVVVAVVVLSNR